MRCRSKIASVATEFSKLAVYRFGTSEAFFLETALVIRLALFCDFAMKRLRVGRFAGVPDSGGSYMQGKAERLPYLRII